MSKSSWKCWVFAAILVASTAMAVSSAEAWCGWGHRWGGYGYGCGYGLCGSGYYGYGHGYGYGCCGSYCSSCCTHSSCYTPCCRSGCGYGCGYRHAYYPTSCCGYGSYGLGYGSYGLGYGGYSTVSAYGAASSAAATTAPTLAPKRPAEAAPGFDPPAPMEAPGPVDPAAAQPEANGNLFAPESATPAPEPAPAPASPGPAADTRASAPAGTAILAVSVPADARVIVNGLATKSTGRYRQFVSTGLKPGMTYKYEVEFRVTRDGQVVEEMRTVYLTSGGREALAFSPGAKPETAVAAL